MSTPPANPANLSPEKPGLPEEMDLWWGSYSPYTMWPSFVACLILSGAIAWAVRSVVPAERAQPVILALAGLLWLVQLGRWAYRVFGFNYRLTTRRVFRDHGLYRLDARQADLSVVAQVTFRLAPLGRLLRLGQVQIIPEDRGRAPLLLDGVRNPEHVVGLIREAVHKARRTDKDS